MRRLVVLTLILGCLTTFAGRSEAAVLYAADGAAGHLSSLVILNPATGAVVSTVGAIGFAVTGLAVHPLTGALYGSTSFLDPTAPGSLLTISKTTGAGLLVGSYGVPNGTMPDLTFTSDGTLYGWAQPLNALHTINLATGHATRVGNFNFGQTVPGAGLAATTTSLILGGSGLGPLFKVNRNTGVAVPFTVGDWPRTDTGLAALAFSPAGTLFAMGSAGVQSVGGNFLLLIDLVSGHVTELGPTIHLGDALAFDPPGFPAEPPTPVPTLSTLAFAAMALLLTAVAIHRVRGRRSPSV